jgi:hypothetical protein
MKKKQTNNNIHTGSPTLSLPQTPTTTNPVTKPGFFEHIHLKILDINGSKFFAGLVMIMLNVGSKFIPIQFSKSAEAYLKESVSKVILVFAMSWMGTRDIYTAIILTLLFVIFSDYLFNEESLFCIVPHNQRILESMNGNNSTNNTTSTNPTPNNNSNNPSNSTSELHKTFSEDHSIQTLELIANTRKKIEADNK